MKPYLLFIFKDRFNKTVLLIAVTAIVLQFTAFKALYPFASYFTDSYTYVGAAANHATISFRPIGYSRFLALVHHISSSETALVYLQYLLMQLGALHLFFTLLYFYQPGRRTRLLLFVLLLFNPLILYLANYVSSDAYFTGLSLFWFAGLLWIINRPRSYQLLLQAAWLFIIIPARLTALYYPFIAIVALLLGTHKRVYKITGSLLFVAVTVFCLLQVQKRTEMATGTRVFSAFSGWQIAGNALHVYCYVEHDTSGLPPSCRELAGFVQTYFDTACPHLRSIPVHANTDYMWAESSPLKKYLYYKWQRDSLPGYFEAWNAVGPLYSSYGAWLIKKHPLAFTQYYLWPSAKTYFLPPPEVMASYNEGADTVAQVAIDWFNYPGKQVNCVSKTLQGRVLGLFPWFFLASNLLLAIGLLGFLLVKKARNTGSAISPSLLLVAFFFVINTGFSIFATPSMLRYEVFPLVIYACFSLLTVGWLRRHRD